MRIIWMALVFLSAATVAAPAQDRVRVGVIERPPFAMQTADGAWTGMAVDLWRLAAEDLGVTYDYVAVEGVEALDTVDVLLPVDATPALEEAADLTHPIYTATMGVASKQQGRVLSVVRGLASWQFLRTVLGLSALLLVVGSVIWLFERRANENQFARSPLRGLGDGFWWAGVTLTTIGYGDKAPRTGLGRAVAMLWMLVGLGVSAALTATVVTMAGFERQVDVPEAFAGRTVGTVEDGSTALFLEREGVAPEVFESAEAALAALDAGTVDIVAAASPVLEHVIAETGGLDLQVRSTRLDPHLVVLALPEGSDLAEALNVAILRRLTAESGWNLIDRYLPE
jgi:ABC-type amino acid transport substrate-binding protein